MKRPISILLAVLGIFALACGFLDPEVVTVTYEAPVPVEFEIDADELCPAGEDCDQEGPDATQDIELMEIDISTEIDIVEATGKDELRNVSSRLRSLEITSISYEVSGTGDDTHNSLTFDLPPLELFVAPVGVDDIDSAESVHLTTLPGVTAETNFTGEAEVEEDNRAASSEIFKDLEFSTMIKAQPIVKEGQPFPPSGSASLKLTINLKLTANPTDG